MPKDSFNLNVQDMEEASVQSGHRVSKLHPKMKQYITGVKNSVNIIDLEKTAEKFGEALNYIISLISEGKNIVLVGTKVPIKALIKESAETCGLPYVNERWLGGTFTNFETILKRVGRFKELIRQKEIGDLEKYTKKEKMKIEKEIEALRTKFGGIKDLQKLPEAVLVFDMKKDGLVAKESKRKGVKVIAVCDTNIDPSLVDYPIPANDDSINSIKYILEKVKEAVLQTKQKTESKEQKTKEE